MSSNQVGETTTTDPIAVGRAKWEKRYGADASAAMEVISSLVRTREILVTYMDRYLADADIDFGEYDVLCVIEIFGDGSLPLGKIADKARRYFHHQTTMTNVVSRLADKGIVSKRADPNDGRVTLIELTPKGKRQLQKAHAILAARQFGFGELSEDEREQLNELLFRVRKAHGDVPG